MVPTFTCGLSRSNFSFATGYRSSLTREPGNILFSGGNGLSRAVLDDLVGDVARDLLVAVELHGVVGTSLGGRPQVCRVPEHLRKRDARLDREGVAARLLTLHAPTAAGDVADHVAEELLRGHDLHRHDGL